MPEAFVDFVDTQLKKYETRFVLNPAQIRGFAAKYNLDWKKIEFNQANQLYVPRCRGVYAFVVEHNHSDFPPHGYIMYIGETGQDGNYNLYKRYGDYLKDKRVPKRPGIHYMLIRWEPCLYFHYAAVKDKRVNLKKLEKSLNDAFIPPFSTNDFSAEIRRGKRAWRP
jgi:hypothetical protein